LAAFLPLIQINAVEPRPTQLPEPSRAAPPPGF